MARVAAGVFGFLTLIHVLDGPERYGASILRGRSTTGYGVEILDAPKLVLGGRFSTRRLFERQRLPFSLADVQLPASHRPKYCEHPKASRFSEKYPYVIDSEEDSHHNCCERRYDHQNPKPDVGLPEPL